MRKIIGSAVLALLASTADAGIVEGLNPNDTASAFGLTFIWAMDKTANESYTTPNNRNWAASLSSAAVAANQNKSLAISVTHSKNNDEKLVLPNPNSLTTTVGPLEQAGNTFIRKKGMQVVEHPLKPGETRKDADLLVWQVTVPPKDAGLATVELNGGHMADVASWHLRWQYTPVQNQQVRVQEAKLDGTPPAVYTGKVDVFRPKPTPENPAAEEYVRSIPTDQNGAFNTEPSYIYRRANAVDAPTFKEVKVLSGSGTTETTLAYLAQDEYGLYSEADMAVLTRFLFPSGFLDVPDLAVAFGPLFVAINLVEWAGHAAFDPLTTFIDFDEFGRNALLPGVLACTSGVMFSEGAGFSCVGEQFFTDVASIAGFIGAQSVAVSEPESTVLVATGLLALMLGLGRRSAAWGCSALGVCAAEGGDKRKVAPARTVFAGFEAS
jgi:hypothetical protein